jgi:hypothetical protein
MVAVGPTQILVVVNGFITVFGKTGIQGTLSSYLDTFFESVRNGRISVDPHARFDRLTQRWFIVAINVETSNRILLAVSDGDTISGVGSFKFFQFRHASAPPAGDQGRFADFPTFGLDAKALYIGTEQYDVSFNPPRRLGASVFVVRKSSVLGPGPIVVTAFRNLATPNGGIYAPQGVSNDDPASDQGYFIGVDAGLFGRLLLRRVNNPGATPSLSPSVPIQVPSTSAPLNVPALGTSSRLHAVDDRLSSATLHRNALSGTRTLWVAHNIEIDARGVGKAGGGRTAARWYELADLASTPRLVQAGTLFDPASADPRHFFMPSLAMSLQGHAALACSTAGAGRYAEAAVAGRLAFDPLGSLRPFFIGRSSTTPYNQAGTNPQRWGDYSETVVDPADGMTLWTAQEYCNSNNSWGVQVLELRAPPPAQPSQVHPSTVQIGQRSVDLVLTGTSSDGSGFFDPGPDPGGPGWPNRLRVTISGGVFVRQVTFDSPTRLRLNISTESAVSGVHNVTIRNPDGQAAEGLGLLALQVDPLPPAGIRRLWPAAGLILLLFASVLRQRLVRGASGRERPERTPA